MPLSQDNFQRGLDCTDTKVLLLCFTPLDDWNAVFYNLCIKHTMKNWQASLIFKSHCALSETHVDIHVGRNTAFYLWVAGAASEYRIPQAGHPVFKVLKMSALMENRCAEQSQALWATLASS